MGRRSVLAWLDHSCSAATVWASSQALASALALEEAREVGILPLQPPLLLLLLLLLSGNQYSLRTLLPSLRASLLRGKKGRPVVTTFSPTAPPPPRPGRPRHTMYRCDIIIKTTNTNTSLNRNYKGIPPPTDIPPRHRRLRVVAVTTDSSRRLRISTAYQDAVRRRSSSRCGGEMVCPASLSTPTPRRVTCTT